MTKHKRYNTPGIFEHNNAIVIEAKGDEFMVRTPWNPRAIKEFKCVYGRRWNCKRQANMIPFTSKGHLWDLLKRCFPGEVGIGPNGPFDIPEAA